MVAAGTLLAACQSTTSGRQGPSPTAIDPSAERLHDICGYLVLYYGQYHSLPPVLEALREVNSEVLAPLPPLVCPHSGRAYLYRGEGVEMPGRPGLLIIHAPTTAEATVMGRPSRWAVLATEFPNKRQLIPQVVLIPESEINRALARAAP